MENKKNIYEDLKLEQYYWGGALSISNINIDLNFKTSVINVLDNICEKENLIPLNEKWNEISYNQFRELLISALQFNLGFSNHEAMSSEKATHYFKTITNTFDSNNCKCFSNCFDHPWNSGSNPYSFNSISNHTIDLALSLINNDKILLIYFFFED